MLTKPIAKYVDDLITYGNSAWQAYHEGESQVEVDYYRSLYIDALETTVEAMSDSYGFTPDDSLKLINRAMQNYMKKPSKK